MQKDKSEPNFDSEGLLFFLHRKRRPLLFVTISATVISLVCSLFIQDKYESTVVLFPTTTSSIAKALISENNTGKEDVLRLGEEEEVEQMLQILHSDEIRDKVIAKYNLMKHYGIDEDEAYKYTELKEEFEDNVTFDRTKFLSVEINVLDKSADTAALIANDIAAYLDTVKNRMRKEIAVEALAIVKDELDAQNAYIKMLSDSIDLLRKKGLINVRAQSERLTEQMAIAVLQGKTKAATDLKSRLDTLSKYAGIFESIQDEIVLEKKRLTVVRAKYREAEIDANRTLQHKFVVDRAYPAEKSTYPLRWLIVLTSTIAAFLITLMLLLFKESFSKLKL